MSIKQAIEALPCPFCGHVGLDFREGTTFRWIVAECSGCGASRGETRIQTLGEGTKDEWMADAREDAIREWNRRAALRSMPQGEPVATIRYERGTPGKENDMPKVVSCNWLPDGVYSVYTTPPPAPVLSDAWISVDERLPGDQGCDSEEVMLFINGHCEITDMECRQGGAWGLRLGYFDAEKQAFRVHGRPESFVTHWMPLPPPPIEQAIGRASKGAK